MPRGVYIHRRGWHHSKETKKNISKALVGRKLSRAARNSISDGSFESWQNPSRKRLRHLKRLHGMLRRTGHYTRLGEMMGAKNGRKVLNRLWKDPEFSRKVLTEFLPLGRKRPSKPQISVLKALCKLIGRGWRLDLPVCQYLLDVANPKLKIAVEMDGEYWHRVNKTDYPKRDRFLRKRGWKTKRFPSSRVGVREAISWVVSLC
jgi:hypothetical protein